MSFIFSTTDQRMRSKKQIILRSAYIPIPSPRDRIPHRHHARYGVTGLDEHAVSANDLFAAYKKAHLMCSLCSMWSLSSHDLFAEYKKAHHHGTTRS